MCLPDGTKIQVTLNEGTTFTLTAKGYDVEIDNTDVGPLDAVDMNDQGAVILQGFMLRGEYWGDLLLELDGTVTRYIMDAKTGAKLDRQVNAGTHRAIRRLTAVN